MNYLIYKIESLREYKEVYKYLKSQNIPVLNEEEMATRVFEDYKDIVLYFAYSNEFTYDNTKFGYEIFPTFLLNLRITQCKVKKTKIIKYNSKSYNNRVKLREIVV